MGRHDEDQADLNWVRMLRSMNRGAASSRRIAVPAAVLLGPDYASRPHTRHAAPRTLAIVTPRELLELATFWVLEIVAALRDVPRWLAEASARTRPSDHASRRVRTLVRRRQGPLTTRPSDAVAAVVRHAAALGLVLALAQIQVVTPAPAPTPEVGRVRPG